MSNEHNNAPAVPQGWKLVPIEPTKEMLDAGLKRKAQARWIDGASVLRSRNENLRPAEEIAALQWEAMLAATPAPSPAVPQGWKLVQTPITEEMHVAAVKVLHRAPGLAGLPQRMLDAMLAATPATAPAQEQCNACLGTGRMVRDPDIGTDQECFVCDGSGYEPEQEVGLTDEELEECFRRAHEEINTAYVPTARFPIGWRLYGRQVIAALRAKGGK